MRFLSRLFSRTKDAPMPASPEARPYATISTGDGFREMTRVEVDAELIAPMTECTAVLRRATEAIERRLASEGKRETPNALSKAHQILAATEPLCRKMSDTLMSMSFESDAAEQAFGQHIQRLFFAQSGLSQAIKQMEKEKVNRLQ